MKSRHEECRQEHASELREYAQLVDIKAARIKKLEGQLKDIAYGTRQYKLDMTQFEYEGSGSSTLEDSIELERGQNLLQFHLAQVRHWISKVCVCVYAMGVHVCLCVWGWVG